MKPKRTDYYLCKEALKGSGHRILSKKHLVMRMEEKINLYYPHDIQPYSRARVHKEAEDAFESLTSAGVLYRNASGYHLKRFKLEWLKDL